MDDFKPNRPDETPTPNTNDESTSFQQAPDSEPETYETATGEPVTDPTVAPAPVTTQKKSHAKKWLLGGVVVVLLAAAGAAIYWQWAEADSAKKELSSVKSQLASAEARVTQLKKETTTDASADTEPAPQSETVQSRADKMAKAMKAASLNTNYVTGVSKVKGDYAELFAGKQNAGGIGVIFKNTPDGLVKIAEYDGVGGMTKTQASSLKAEYGFDAAEFGLPVN